MATCISRHVLSVVNITKLAINMIYTTEQQKENYRNCFLYAKKNDIFSDVYY